MSRMQPVVRDREETPVDDVRRIRERLDREAGGDVRLLMEQSHRFFEDHGKSLGLKRISLNAAPRSQRKHRITVNRRRSRV